MSNQGSYFIGLHGNVKKCCTKNMLHSLSKALVQNYFRVIIVYKQSMKSIGKIQMCAKFRLLSFCKSWSNIKATGL